jgi:3-hydroxyisobutyrate dehydrogenase
MNHTRPTPSIALLGLGIMGSGMANRLLGAGFRLTIFNRTPEKAAPFVERGAKLAPTPHEAVTRANIIISMVADDSSSRSVWLGEQGALAGAIPGTVLIESSTLSLPWINDLAAAAAARDCELLDAPVTGSKAQAASGELNFLVGGSERALEKARVALTVMSRSIVHVGPSGSGALLKLINNFLCGVQVASLAEAVAWIENSGADSGQMLEFLKNGAGGSPLIKLISERMSHRDFTPNFLLRLMAKDLGYAVDEATRRSLELATGSAALSVFKQAITGGYGDKDMSAVVEPFRNNDPA